MVRKFFAQDKNYLLEESQLRLRENLLQELVSKAKVAYEQHNNPLGLNDNFSLRIGSFQPENLDLLHSFYETLSGIYRYKYGENQLGFLWDGKDHREKYGEEWSGVFNEWTNILCRQIQFAQAVLDLTVFFPPKGLPQMAENRMKAVMLQLFELRIHKKRGIVVMRVA